MTNQLFNLGRVVGTPGALQDLDPSDVFQSLLRHANGDWGDVCPADQQSNNQALLSGDRLLSAYTSNGTKFWIITEWDRSATTILLPDEY